MRKWTERKIALYGFWLSILGLILSTVLSAVFGILTYNLSQENNRISTENKKISREAQDLNQKTFCTNLIMPKLEALTEKLISLPVLLSGCAKRPREFCDRARTQFEQTRDILLHLTGSLENSQERLNKILETINSLETIISGSLDNHQKEIVMIAGTLSRQKRELGFIKPVNLKCISN